MASIPVTAWLPLRIPWLEHASQSTYSQNLDLFVGHLPGVISAMNDRITSVAVAFGKPKKKIRGWLIQKSFLASTKLCEFLIITANVEVDVDQLNEINHLETTDVELVFAVALSDIAETIEHALLLSELAHPGCIDVLEGLALGEERYSYPIHSKSTFRFLRFPDTDDPLWPPISDIPMSTVVEWARRVGIGERGLAKGRIERAVASYTHVVGLTWQRDGEVLFRAMQGLEAFYCDGIGGLRSQLSEKIQIWLGPWTDKKNIVGQLYDLRSKFVHGTARLEYWNHHRDPWTEDEQTMAEFSAGVYFAIRLLISTLQKCITDGITDVRWSFTVQPRS